MTTTLPSSLHLSPYFAGLDGKSRDERDAFQDRIDALPPAARGLLFDPTVSEKLSEVLEQYSVPTQYSIALAKIIFLAALGDISINSIDSLLQKLGLEQRQAALTAAGLTMILGEVIAERGRATTSGRIREIPTLTQRVPQAPPVPDSSKQSARNIIDLRKQ